MQFPRINSAINLTLLYYEKHQIVLGVGQYSKEIQRAGVTFNGKLLPDWDSMVMRSHQAMEDEILQIISLNYPYVQSIVFENLREVLNDVRIKSLNKEWIIHIADENNKAEEDRIATIHPNGFAVMINKDYLQHYFALVENAISNLKRIINKYLKQYDEGKLPQQLPNQFLPTNTTPLVADESKIKVNVTGGQIVALFKLLHDQKPDIFNVKNPTELREFIINHFIAATTRNEKMNKKKTANNFSSPNPKDIKYWIPILKKMWEEAAGF